MTPHFSQPFWTNRVRPSLDLSAETGQSIPDWVVQRLQGIDLLQAVGADESGVWEGATSLPYVYLPDKYEANYAYPLIVWLTDPLHSERQLLDFMPILSDQNYVAMSLPGFGNACRTVTGQQPSTEPVIDDVAASLRDRVYQVRRIWHVHSERVYVAGCDRAASLALGLLLKYPEWFAGSLCFGHVDCPSQGSLTQYHELHGKRVFLGADMRQPRASLSAFARTTRLLHSAGLKVSARMYDAEEPVTSEVLTDANHWLMEGVCESNVVL